VSINGRRWMDGGMRSSANADLAGECERIVVLAPLARGFGALPSLASQVAALRQAGRAVIKPDQAALTAIGRDVLDPAARAPAARAGYAQAATAAAEVRPVWAG
jgi:NTE family protein